MKKLMFVLVIGLMVSLFGCDDTYRVSDDCEYMGDLCPSSGHYYGWYSCTNDSSYWYEVNGVEYYSISSMWDELCR